MMQTLLILVLLLVAITAGIGVVLLRRMQPLSLDPILTAVAGLERGQERIERGVREEIARGREESTGQAKQLRDEVHALLKGLNDSLVRTLSELAAGQKSQLDGFAGQLLKLTDIQQAGAKQLREETSASIKAFNDSILKQIADLVALQKSQLEGFSSQLLKLTETNQGHAKHLREETNASVKGFNDSVLKADRRDGRPPEEPA